jgi:hypothetical protein
LRLIFSESNFIIKVTIFSTRGISNPYLNVCRVPEAALQIQFGDDGKVLEAANNCSTKNGGFGAKGALYFQSSIYRFVPLAAVKGGGVRSHIPTKFELEC